MTATRRVVIVGVGNAWRRDDGAGPAVATAVRGHLGRSRRSGPDGGPVDGHGHRIEVIDLDGETARLIDAWDGAELAVVVDAVRTGRTPGELHRLDAASDEAGGLRWTSGCAGATRSVADIADPSSSSHGLGVAQAVELARVLGRLPRRLVLVGVEGVDFGPGDALTAAVADAVEPAARLVTDVVEGKT